VGGVKVWVVFDSFGSGLNGLLKFALSHIHVTEQGVRFPEFGIEFQRPLQKTRGAAQIVRVGPMDPAHGKRLAQRGIGHGVGRIEIDGALKMLPSLLQRIFAEHEETFAALRVLLISFDSQSLGRGNPLRASRSCF
jgi:hypothetical protein